VSDIKIVEDKFNACFTAEKEEERLFPFEVLCDECGSKFLVESEDELEEGYAGMSFVECPCCHKKTASYNDYFDRNINKDNVKFPKNFYRFVKGKDVSAEKIQQWIKDAIKNIRREKSQYYYYASGNACVFVMRFEGDEAYEIIVSKDYYDLDLPFEAEDYY